MPSSTNSIFLLPYGGGSAASFRSYVDDFPPEIGHVIPLELAGRGKRSDEEGARTIRECAALALQQIDITSGDYVLHGHCMGALLAFEAIKLIQGTGGQLPRFMVVSGRNAPRHTNEWLLRVATMDDRGLFSELQQLGAVPEGLNFAMAQPFLTKIRGDHAMFCDYSPGEARIGVPILALAGKSDKMTNASALAEWRDYTSVQLSIEWLDGGHYFIIEQPRLVAHHLAEFSKRVDNPPTDEEI
ncbi:MAG: thioesterase [Arenicella sp.]|nr:thioesterase [Arenicella sp.]